MSPLRKPYLSKMIIYSSLKYNMFLSPHAKKRLFRGDSNTDLVFIKMFRKYLKYFSLYFTSRIY